MAITIRYVLFRLGTFASTHFFLFYKLFLLRIIFLQQISLFQFFSSKIFFPELGIPNEIRYFGATGGAFGCRHTNTISVPITIPNGRYRMTFSVSLNFPRRQRISIIYIPIGASVTILVMREKCCLCRLEIARNCYHAQHRPLRHEAAQTQAAVDGSSEGHFVLKRHDICRLKADVELIPKMFFLSKLVHGFKNALLCQTWYFCFWRSSFTMF